MRRKRQQLRVDVPRRPALLSHRAWTALGMYALMGGVAVAWASWQSYPLLNIPGETQPRHGWSFFLGGAVAIVTIAGTRWAVPRISGFRSLHRSFRDVLGPLQNREIAIFAISSGVAEELLFRGAMVPALGLVVSSAFFGIVHIAPQKPRWVWPLWATCMGLVFASIYVGTGSLLGPIFGHILINWVNLRYIDRFDPDEGSDESFASSPEFPERNRSS